MKAIQVPHFLLKYKNTRGTTIQCIEYSAYARFGPYCDYDYDGYGNITSRLIDVSQIDNTIKKIITQNGPSVSTNGFLDRPDYTIHQLENVFHIPAMLIKRL